MKKYLYLFILLFSFSSITAQNPLEKFEFLIGNWQGVESGVAGDGIGFRTYNWELGQNFIFVKNQSTFPKTEKKPMGEVHRDIGVFSYNPNTEKYILREFHVENFVNIYELDTEQSSGDKLVFLTREIENNPGNWKAKLILTKTGEDKFTEEFLIATNGKDFKPFLKNEWTKVK
ncbi:hypothetical protein [Salegentibacter chungangensis]|uniref:DUF1579 domain-containing protein n=1 Tax=Salegentibacter chungangensis TaxID=1335724 RepID=A0ABW3NNK0_9FLAO